MTILNVILLNVKSCCCGLTSLRTGTIIIFLLTLIFSILQLFGWFVPSIVVSINITDYEGNTDVKNFPPILDYYTIQYALLGVLVSTCGFVGLYKVSNRKSSILLPYITVTAVETVLLWIVVVLTVSTLHSRKQIVRYVVAKFHAGKEFTDTGKKFIDATDSLFDDAIVRIIIAGLVFSVINWYCLSVVDSYYEQLQSEEQSNQGNAPRQDMMLNSMP